jgi:hypothetical protein
MGLVVDRFEFDGPPPEEVLFVRLLRERIGGTYGLDAFTSQGNHVDVYTMFDPVVRPYACALLLELGGRPVSFMTNEPRSLTLPDYVKHPWVEHPWHWRLAVRWKYVVGFWIAVVASIPEAFRARNRDASKRQSTFKR